MNIYQIDKINITRMTFAGRIVPQNHNSGGTNRDVLPTGTDPKIVTEAIEEAIQTSLGEGDLSRVVELENAKSK